LHRQYQDGDSTWKLQIMFKKWLFYIGIIMIVGSISTAFKPIDSQNHKWFYVDSNEELLFQLPLSKVAEQLTFVDEFIQLQDRLNGKLQVENVGIVFVLFVFVQAQANNTFHQKSLKTFNQATTKLF